MKLPRIGAPAGFGLAAFAAVLLNGASFGPTDDEAYYWALSADPSLGFAYHPPGVVWAIAASRAAIGWVFDFPNPLVLRFPSAAFTGIILFLALAWVRAAAGAKANLPLAGAVMLAFAGFFGASWMIVPDLPMFAGWMVLFHATWVVTSGRADRTASLALASGAALCLLGKFSGILAIASSAASIAFWCPRPRRVSALAWLGAGAAAGLLPSLVWNATHSWDAILYQLRDRHGGELSAARYGRFWGSQLLLAGPPLIVHAFLIAGRLRRGGAPGRISRFAFIWAAPALIFLVQPLFSDFKPHWAFAAWLPATLELAALAAAGKSVKLARAQVAFGLPVLAVVLASCHFPLLGWVARATSGSEPDPRLDVTNDLYGWDRLRGRLEADLPILASRYQTAGQASFALGPDFVVSRVPREVRELGEWVDPGVTDSVGPEWPKLLRPALYVSDNRYSARPEFRGARCAIIDTIDEKRFGLAAKRIDVWRCVPRRSG